jgi:arsenate reductase
MYFIKDKKEGRGGDLIFYSKKGKQMEKITVYEKPTCTTCRKVSKLLNELGVDFEKVNYYIKPFSKSRLRSLLKKMGMKPEELLRKNEAAYKQLDMQNNPMSEEELIEKMIQFPDLVQRPVIEIGDKAVLARPPEKLKEFLKKEKVKSKKEK